MELCASAWYRIVRLIFRIDCPKDKHVSGFAIGI